MAPYTPVKASLLARSASVLLLLFPEFEFCTEHMNTCTPHADGRTTTREPGRNKIHGLCELKGIQAADKHSGDSTNKRYRTISLPQITVFSFLSNALGANSFGTMRNEIIWLLIFLSWSTVLFQPRVASMAVKVSVPILLQLYEYSWLKSYRKVTPNINRTDYCHYGKEMYSAFLDATGEN